jgi:protein TonB
MKQKIKKKCLAAAIILSLFAVHGVGAAATSDPSRTIAQVEKTKKKTVKKTKARKSSVKVPLPKEDAAATAASVEFYKKELAQRISDASPAAVYPMQPQALLRSVVVVQFVIDKNGKLIRSAIQRSNHDPATEDAALASLRNAAPFPKPPVNLLTKGRLVLSETWLFNDDGRFQLRSIALAQKSE